METLNEHYKYFLYCLPRDLTSQNEYVITLSLRMAPVQSGLFETSYIERFVKLINFKNQFLEDEKIYSNHSKYIIRDVSNALKRHY